MPSYLNVYNTSLEDFKTQINSTAYRFLARSLTKVPEEYGFALPQYDKHGLVVIKPGDDLDAKEKEGLMNYLGFLEERKAYCQMYIDEKKRNGVTVPNPPILGQVDQWIKEIKEKYASDNTFKPIKSFKDEALPLDAKKLFAGEMNVKSVEQIVNESLERKPKKFTEVNIKNEIRN